MPVDRSSLALAVIARRLEQSARLDPLLRTVDHAIPAGFRSGLPRRVLSGSWLGHSLHPLLTDLPVGFWASASVLDVVGGQQTGSARRSLVGLGLLAAVPTMAAGASDWSQLNRPVQRVGAAHAAFNVVAFACYGASYLARRRNPESGRRSAAAGAAALLAGGFLGADLSLTRAVTRDNQLLPDA